MLISTLSALALGVTVTRAFSVSLVTVGTPGVASLAGATVAASLKLEARIPGLVFISLLISITDKTKYFPSTRGFK